MAYFIPRTAAAAEEEEDGDEGTNAAAVSSETAAQLIVRMDAFVRTCLHEARKKGGKHPASDGLLYEERRKARQAFIAAAKGWKQCRRCQA